MGELHWEAELMVDHGQKIKFRSPVFHNRTLTVGLRPLCLKYPLEEFLPSLTHKNGPCNPHPKEERVE